MKKKILSFIFAICMVFPTIFGLTACGKNDGGNNGSGHTHTYGEWDIIKDASCTEKGSKKRVCSECGNVENATIPAKGHEYEDGLCTECGYYNPAKDTNLSDGRTFENIIISKTGVLKWTGLKCASKYVLTIKDSSNTTHTYTTTNAYRIFNMADLEDDYSLAFGKNTVTLTAYESEEVTISGQKYEQDIPISTAKDSFDILSVNSGYSIVRKTYFDEYATMNKFDSVAYHDDTHGDYLLFEQAGKASSKYLAKGTKFSVYDKITPVDSNHSVCVYDSEENKNAGSALDEDAEYELFGGEYEWLYIDILDFSGIVVKSYTALLYCTRPLDIYIYKIDRAEPDASGDIAITKTELDGFEMKVTENNILNINEIYKYIPEGMLIRDENYTIYEKNTDYNTKDMIISGNIDYHCEGSLYLYYGDEDEIREHSAEVKTCSEMFDLDFKVGYGNVPYWEIVYKENHNNETVVIPAKIIGYKVETDQSSFKVGSELKHVIFESGTTSLSGKVLYNCDYLRSVKIPDTVTSMGSNILSPDLESPQIYLEGSESSMNKSGNMWNRIGSTTRFYSYMQNQMGCCSVVTANGVSYKCETSGTASVIGATGTDVSVLEVVKLGTKSYNVTKIQEIGSSVTSISVPKTITSISESVLTDALTEISVDEQNQTYVVFDGILYNKAESKILYIINKNMTTLTLHECITEITDARLAGLASVVKINIHSGITNIDLSLFASHNIKEFVVDADNETYSSIAGNLYNKNQTELIRVAIGNENLTIVPTTVTTIQKGAFKGYTLSKITVPLVGGSLTENQYLGYIFGLDSYSDHSSLPATLTEIEITGGAIAEHAFYGCTNLTTITIGESVTAIGDYAFAGCDKLTQVNFNATACADLTSSSCVFDGVGTSIGFAVAFGKNVTSIPAYLLYNSKLVSVTFLSNVTTIGACAFRNTLLTSVTIPESVVAIGNYAFGYCTDLTQVNFNATACADLTANSYVFSGSGVDSGFAVVFGSSVSSVPAYMLKDSKVSSVTISESVTTIGSCAFNSCEKLTSITIPKNITTIGSYAFANCAGLEQINFNATACSDLSSSSRVFDGAGNSTGFAVTFGNNVTNIPAYLLHNSKLTSVTFLGNVTTIGADAFNGTLLTSVAIPESVTIIGNYAFNSCEKLTSITIPGNVVTIGNGAFYACSNIESITIPKSVTAIGEKAFMWCKKLTSITIPENVTTIGKEVFSNCTGLTQINFNAKACESKNRMFSGSEFESECVVIYGSSVTKMPEDLLYGSKVTSVIISEGVTEIGRKALRMAKLLTSVKIPTSVTSIETYAFFCCESLISIEIPSKVTSIGEFAFGDCKALTSIEIPSSVTSIKYHAFSYCENLKSIILKNPNGWTAATTYISASDLLDPSTAAKYFVETYYYCNWTRES